MVLLSSASRERVAEDTLVEERALEKDPPVADAGRRVGRAGAGLDERRPAATDLPSWIDMDPDLSRAARFCLGEMSGADVVEETWIDCRRL